MILSDRSLITRLYGGLVEFPGEDHPVKNTFMAHLQPCSVEVTLAEEIVRRIDPSDLDDDPWSFSLRRVTQRTNHTEPWELAPGEFVLASTREKVNVPPDLVGFVHGKSSLARKGLLIHVTAGLLDPGFSGDVTLEMKNVSDEYITLTPGMRIAQLAFHQLTTDALRPYGSEELGSHYFGQQGPTESWM